MATVLYLNDTQVYPDGQQNIKLTKENPYFTQSDSYTLDVTLPMDILENRDFFKNLHRKDRSKVAASYQCRLEVDNHTVLRGTATVTQVTEQSVKVQLLGGNSEVNFLSADEGAYIDEMDLGEWTGGRPTVRNGYVESDLDGVRVMPLITHDETSDTNNVTLQPRLIDIAEKIIRLSGFTIEENFTDRVPWNSLYVANSKQTRYVADMLPHWLTRDFFREFCQFFNVTMVIDQVRRTVRLVSNIEFYGEAKPIKIDPVDEYTADLIADEDKAEVMSLANDNLEFDLSSSEHHVQDCLQESARETIPKIERDTFEETYRAWFDTAAASRRKYIYKCTAAGLYASWVYDLSLFGDGSAETEVLEKVDHLGPLIRQTGSNASERTLKIVPVAIARFNEHIENLGAEYDLWWNIPSLESPTGQGTFSFRTGSSRRAPAATSAQEPEYTVQDMAEGDAQEEKGEKEDRMQVMFIDSASQVINIENSSVRGKTEYTGITGFTDWRYKNSPKGEQHQKWSLSLNPADGDAYLGQLHNNGFSFNMKAKHTFKFLSRQMPDPTSVFLIHSHLYACEKIEANVTADGFDRLMTGYFHEMTD